MKTNSKLFLATCAFALLTACGNNTSNNASNSGAAVALTGSPLGNAPSAAAQTANAYTPMVSAEQDKSPMKARDLSAAPTATHIALGTIVANQLTAISNQATNGSDGKPFQIGFGRDVVQTGTAGATKQMLKWQTTATGGSVAALNFNSPGAKGMRIGLVVTQLHASATLRFYAKAAATAYEVNGTEVQRVLAANLAAGDKTVEGRTFWGPVVDGADASIEIELPAGVGADTVDVSMPTVSHLFMSIKDGSAIAPQATDTKLNEGLSCQVDVSCATTLPAASNAVVWLAFSKGGGQFICSGTLLNDTINSGTPYVLTANHCIDSQTVASTLYSESRYRSTSCNATSHNFYPTLTNGAALLYTAYNTDSTLLRLAGTPTAGVLYAGWDASTTPAASTAVSNIHHPKGDSQRLSRGSVTSYYNRNPSAANSFFESTAANSTILGVSLTTGLTEGGSSGSGLFKGTDANPQLIGQLYGGQAPSCASSSVFNVYGRFDVAYRAGMRTWLSPDTAAPSAIRQPVYRFYIPQSGVYFYTIYPSERDSILATLSNVFTYEGIAFYASPTPTAGYDPIFRFRNTLNGSYLYTISSVERDSILQSYPQYVLEGTAWYAQKAAVGDGSPLYRFRTNNGTHIYTAYESEKASILANYTSFVLEGPAYYVKLTP